ncbi:MAG: hypothetical protein P8X70_00535 [Nanoarchaeota archaeon]
MSEYQFDKDINKKLQIGKIICLARTYHKHAEEMNTKTTKEPLLFLSCSKKAEYVIKYFVIYLG